MVTITYRLRIDPRIESGSSQDRARIDPRWSRHRSWIDPALVDFSRAWWDLVDEDTAYEAQERRRRKGKVWLGGLTFSLTEDSKSIQDGCYILYTRIPPSPTWTNQMHIFPHFPTSGSDHQTYSYSSPCRSTFSTLYHPRARLMPNERRAATKIFHGKSPCFGLAHWFIEQRIGTTKTSWNRSEKPFGQSCTCRSMPPLPATPLTGSGSHIPGGGTDVAFRLDRMLQVNRKRTPDSGEAFETCLPHIVDYQITDDSPYGMVRCNAVKKFRHGRLPEFICLTSLVARESTFAST